MDHQHAVLEKQIKMEVPEFDPEFDPNFEPQFRARSNTWPLRPREIIKTEDDNRSTPTGSDGGGENVSVTEGVVSKDSLILKAKTTSRRNAWGNLSYADLITKAIEGSPEKRLTLSQIYDWMVQNVPYFKDKGDTNSSAGWKNSIRHNLSLHSRFMRIQNEGTGKSSWWVLNPDAKPGKSPRRRATSMDTKAYEKKRSRVKKKLDQLRALGVDHSPKGSDFGDGDLGHGADPFSLSPLDFHPRTSSNASSLGGRLSPIQSMYEPDLHDQVSPMPRNQASSYNNSEGFTETLSESLAEMFVGDALSPSGTGELGRSSLSTPSPLQAQSSPSGYLPPPYNVADARHTSPQQLSPNNIMDNGMATGPCMDSGINQSAGMSRSMNPMMNSISPMASELGGHDIFLEDQFMSQTLSSFLNEGQSAVAMSASGDQTVKPLQNNDNGNMMTSGDNSDMNSSLLRQALTEKQQLVRSQLQAALQNQHQRQLLQARLKQLQQHQIQRQMQQRLQMQLQQQQMKRQQMMQQQQQQQQQQYQSLQQPSGLPQSSPGNLQQNLMAGGLVQQVSASDAPNRVVPSEAGSDVDVNFTFPGDLDLVTIAELTTEDLDCNVDEIISHELSMDGLLDFNFDGSGNNSGGTVQT